MTGQVFVTGGAGYAGCVLIPKLLDRGHRVVVLDLCLYGEGVLDHVRDHPNFRLVKGDIRDVDLLRSTLRGVEIVIHLACISNDPSFDLDPALGKSINYDAFRPLVEISKAQGARRFVFASSSSVYGIKNVENVTEDEPCEPITDYSRYKELCEEILRSYQDRKFRTVIVRPATICGYSPRLRLDLVVNILTNHAVNTGCIKVFGGSQQRPNIHIEDITDLYADIVDRPDHEVGGKTWNVGNENCEVGRIAEIVRSTLGNDSVQIQTEPSDDNRSYHVSSARIEDDIGFKPSRTIADAVADLRDAFSAGLIPDPMEDIRYYNIRTMQATKI